MKRLVLLATLFARAPCCRSSKPAAPPPATDAGAAARLPSSQRSPGGAWYGIYVGGKKVGWAHFALRQGSFGGAPALELRSTLRMKAAYGSLEVAMEADGSRFYESGGAQRLLAIRKKLRQGPIATEVDVRREGEKMIALRRVGGATERRELPAAKETAQDDLFVGAAAALKVGEVRRGHVFVEELLQEFAVTTRVLSAEEAYHGGVRLPLVRARLEGLPMGLSGEARLTPEGELVSSEMGPVGMRLEGEAAAKRLDATTNLVDINPSVARLPARGPAVVRLRATGLDPALAVNDARQTFEKLPDGAWRITLRRQTAPARSVRRPVAGAEHKQDLEATAVLQADHPEIRRAAEEAVGGETDAFRAALRLRDWVHRRMKPTWHRTLDALTALRAGGGMCYELAHVLAAMARAAGIPARLAYGLVYAETKDGAVFGGHAWTELFVGEWMVFDPTEKEGPAMGPHLKLGTREAGGALQALGKLKLAWE